MGNEVYANGQEVSCKAAAGKSIAAFPDVCFTPPLTPATPPGVPIPYPNTGMASDTSGGTKTVQISGKEVMMKDSSYFKTSTGDEAGSAPKKNVITSKIKGKCYYTAWSMDVKVEGENAVRHLDMMTHNHASNPGATPPWAYIDAAAMSEDCKKIVEDKNKCMEDHYKKNTHKGLKEEHRKDKTGPIGKAKAAAVAGDFDWEAVKADKKGKETEIASRSDVEKSFCADPECEKTLKCALVPMPPTGFCCAGADGKTKTGHHVVPAHCFMPRGGRGDDEPPYPHVKDYKHAEAPTICLEGKDKSASEGGNKKEHGKVHDVVDPIEDSHLQQAGPTAVWKRGPDIGKPKPDQKMTAGIWTFEQANDAGAEGIHQTTGCPKECIKQQSAAAHQKMDKNIGPGTELRADSGGGRTPVGPDFPKSVTPPAPVNPMAS
jgi:hypothetical protein